ncbi:MAG TPA: hypothetical protein VM581_02430 [Magnetospirillaceae bacterium]|nr:hypothetical protein [Magnetospirillaceae bacterium]
MLDPDLAPLGDKLGMWWPWRLIFDKHPVVIALIFILISPVMMWVFDILVVHGRFIPLSHQWLSAQFDIALAVAIATMAAMLRGSGVPMQHFAPWLRSWPLHLLLVVLGLALSAAHMYQERGSITTVERRTGINSLYHNGLLYVILVYALGLLLCAVAWMFIRHGAWREPHMILGLLVVFGLIYAWYRAGVYDGSHQLAPDGTSKHDLANPEHPWRDGLIPQFIGWLKAWLSVHITPLF